MDKADPPRTATPSPSGPAPRRPSGPLGSLLPSPRARLYGCVGCILLTVAAFSRPLARLFDHALRVDLDSYIALVPFITAYLLYIKGKRLPQSFASSPGWAVGFALAGTAALAASWRVGAHLVAGPGESDYLALTTLAFLCWVVAAGFFLLGRSWMAAAAFPAAFLVFMIPLPNEAIIGLENGSKYASAEIANLFFELSGTPKLRDGLMFQLPGITLEVAPECSGIHSSLVLFVTSVLAAHLFLRGTWRRLLLVLFVIPLGIVRNGFRIWTIGQLCVYVGPQMINSVIHRRGGPLFFALSLLPLFFLIWWLRRGENRNSA